MDQFTLDHEISNPFCRLGLHLEHPPHSPLTEDDNQVLFIQTRPHYFRIRTICPIWTYCPFALSHFCHRLPTLSSMGSWVAILGQHLNIMKHAINLRMLKSQRFNHSFILFEDICFDMFENIHFALYLIISLCNLNIKRMSTTWQVVKCSTVSLSSIHKDLLYSTYSEVYILYPRNLA